MGAGDSSRPDRPSTGLLLNATRGSARWALPLFSLLLTMHTGEGNAPPAPPRYAVGEVSGGCYTDSSGYPLGLAPAGWPSFGPPAHHSAPALCRSF